MATKTIIKDMVTNGDSVAVQVSSGQYMIAVGGTFGGGTITLKVNVGPAIGVPVDGAVYTTEKAEIVWFPNCTVYVTLAGATSPDLNIAIAELTAQVD